MENKDVRKYRFSPLSGQITYDMQAAKGNGSGTPNSEVVFPVSNKREQRRFDKSSSDTNPPYTSQTEQVDYPFGRAVSFTTPTGNDVRTHDEVVGGGHTIEVQNESINQIGKFQHRNKLSRFGKNDPYRTENATVAEPMRDNFGVALEPEKSRAEMRRDLGKINADRAQDNKYVYAENCRKDRTHSSENMCSGNHAKGNLEINSKADTSAVNSAFYGNSETDRDIYGDFFAESSAYTGKNSDCRRDDNTQSVSFSRQKNRSVMGDGEDNDTNGENDRQEEGEKGTEKEKDKAVTVKSGEKLIKTIVIAGQIEGHTQLPQGQKATRYEELIPQLVEIEESDEIEGLLLILNTVGGDVEAGLALSEMIAGMKKPTASLVLGGGHSIGVPLAVSAKRSFIVPSATMTLHPVRVTGMVLSAPQTYVYLNNMQERIIDFTCSHCNITRDRFYELMLAREEMSTDLGSVLDGKKAVEEGLIDALGTLADAISFLKGEK